MDSSVNQYEVTSLSSLLVGLKSVWSDIRTAAPASLLLLRIPLFILVN